VHETPRYEAGDNTRPTAVELESAGKVAPRDDPDRYFSERERATAQWLRSRGVEGVRSVDRRMGQHEKTPDAVFDHPDGLATVEFKDPDKPTAQSVRRSARSGRKQSGLIVIDYRDELGTGMERETGIEGMRAAVRNYGAEIEQMIVILGDGTPIGWKP
jgi:hypothetical protein